MGKTTVAALLARTLAGRGLRTLAVDCDPNPNLAESFRRNSGALERLSFDALRRAGDTLVLAGEPALVEVGPDLSLLGGPPSATPLPDAVARGIAGVLLAPRFDAVVTDLGAGPEYVEMAVGGRLNPADVCAVLTNGRAVAALTADRIERASRRRGVASVRILNAEGDPHRAVVELLRQLPTAR